MAINGFNSLYNSNSSSQLASLLRSSSLNTRMIKMAYKNLADINSNKYISSTKKTEELINKYLENSEKYKNVIENSEALSKNTASMRSSSANLLSASSMSDEDFIKSVKDFTENYNKTVETLKDSENYVAVSSGIHMVNTTRSYYAALERVGITVNDDNTLSVNEAAMKENIEGAKSMFKGNYSFGGKMAKKASDLQTIAMLGNSTGIYNRYGLFDNNY